MDCLLSASPFRYPYRAGLIETTAGSISVRSVNLAECPVVAPPFCTFVGYTEQLQRSLIFAASTANQQQDYTLRLKLLAVESD
jgi:hypothetical protein